MSKNRETKKIRIYASEAERSSGEEPSVEVEISASYIRIACMNGRHRAVIIANVVAEYLRRM
eukprot:8358025-Karenia_brevis.AAC.1